MTEFENLQRITICRTHSGSLLPKPMSDGFFCFNRSMMVQDIGPCDPVPMVWSGDGVALLAIKECGQCLGAGNVYADGLGGQAVVCPSCGGKGYTYAAETRPATRANYNTGEVDSPGVAVVELLFAPSSPPAPRLPSL